LKSFLRQEIPNLRAPTTRPAPEIQATLPEPTESGTKSAQPKPKRTRNTQTGAQKPNLNQKRRDSCGKKQNRAENHTRRTRGLAAVPHGAARSIGAEHERNRAGGLGTKSKLLEGLKCKINGRKKWRRGEERSGRGRDGFYRRTGGGGLGATQLRGDVFAAGTPESRSIARRQKPAVVWRLGLTANWLRRRRGVKNDLLWCWLFSCSATGTVSLVKRSWFVYLEQIEVKVSHLGIDFDNL